MLTFDVAIIFASQRSLYSSVRSVGIFAAIFASVYGFTSKSFLYLSLYPHIVLSPPPVDFLGVLFIIAASLLHTAT